MHTAVKVEGDEFGSFWRYRGVSLRYDREEREWTFTMYLPRGWARVMESNRAAAMRHVDKLIDEENFVPDRGVTYHPARWGN